MPSSQALELQQQLRLFKEGTTQESASMEQLRASVQMLATVATEPVGVTITDVDAGGCHGLMHRPNGAANSRGAVLWLHGGGYGLFSARTHSRMAGHFSLGWGLDVLTLDFRLAPEHPFPAALDDAVNAYKWLRSEGYDRVIIGGDSAGAGHAVAAMLKLRDDRDALPDAGILISGWYDLRLEYPSITERADRDLTTSADLMALLRENYLNGHSVDDPLVSPIKGDLTGLPALYVTVSEEEVLFDDSRFFIDRALEAGVSVESEINDVVPHVHTFWAGTVPEADETIQRIANWLDKQK